MATGLRPDLVVRQVFRTAQPVVPASTLPAVLVGVNRQLEYRVDAGTYVGGQENGDYSFPNLTTGAAIEPATSTDPVLRPKVYLSTDYGVSDITDDVTFANLSNVGAAPSFEIAVNPEATFEVATGATGSYDATGGLFTDPNADFIENRVGVGDVIKLGGTPSFTVAAVNSDDELEVTKLSHGPSDAAVVISAASATGVRTVTYTGDLGNAYDGFVANKVRVGDTVNFDGWKNLATSGTLYYGATVNGIRTLTLTSGSFNGVVSGNIISLYVIRDGVGTWIPYFIAADTVSTAATTLRVINITSDISEASSITSAEALAYKVSTPTRTQFTDGAFTAQATDGTREFTTATTLTNGQVILTYPAVFTSVTSSITTQNTITREDAGSFVTGGYYAGQQILITSSSSSANVGVLATIATVATSVITVEGTPLTNVSSTSLSLIPLPVAGLFLVSDAANDEVLDLYPGVIPATAFGSNLTATRVALADNGSVTLPDLPTVSATFSSVNRSLIWPSSLSSTLPVAGDFVFSEDGDLLFEVVTAINTTATATLSGASGASGTITFTGAIPTGLNVTAGAKFQLAGYGSSATYTVVSVLSLAVSVTADDGSFSNASSASVSVQQVIVKNHADAPIVIASTDTASGALVLRDQDEATYKVLRVNSETEIQVKASSTATEIPSGTTIIRGATTSIVVPDLLSDEAYTIEKTLSGTDLEGTVLVTYAARRKDHLNELVEVTQATVTDLVGPAVPHNPLGLAALNAVNNTAVPVYCVQVGDDTDAGWTTALNLIKTNQVYAVAPLTQDEERLTEFQAHVTTQSQPENKRERILFQSHRNETQITRWTMASVESATFVKTSSTQTITVTTASGLVGLGVKPGDVVSGTFYGNIVGQGFVTGSLASLSTTGTTLPYARIANVSELGGETTLTLVPIDDSVLGDTLAAGVDMVTLTIKSKVLNTTQYRDAIAAYPASIQNRRVRNVYPDRALITFDDTTNANDTSVGFYGGGEVASYEVGGWLMAAIAAAQRSGLPASTPLTRRGFTGIQRLVNPFGDNVSDLDVILDGGNYLLAQDGGDGSNCSAVRAITTNTTDLNYLEEAVGVQVDNMARKLRTQISPILGTTILDEGFFDLYSTISSAVISDIIRNKEMREITLISISEDPVRADTFLASYQVRPYFSAAKGDVTIFI